MSRNQRRRWLLGLCVAVATGCGGSEAYKLEPNPEIDYQAREREASEEEDLSEVNARTLERKSK